MNMTFKGVKGVIWRLERSYRGYNSGYVGIIKGLYRGQVGSPEMRGTTLGVQILRTIVLGGPLGMETTNSFQGHCEYGATCMIWEVANHMRAYRII